MARPRKDKPDARAHVVSVRLTPDERVQLEERAQAACLSLSDFFRHSALGARIQAAASPGGALAAKASTPDGIEHVVALNRIGVNLNQIARSLNSGLSHEAGELVACLSRVNALLDDWQGVSS
jgi:hypothetical protein